MPGRWITLSHKDALARAELALDPFLEAPAAEEPDPPRLVAPVRAGTRLVDVVRALDAAGVEAVDVQRREPTLDDVFLTITAKSRSAAGVAA